MTAFEDLSLLRAFVSIVECGSISAGARRLRISQPTLSRHLRTLEERCGAALLRRDTHRMCVTETGQRLLADAQAMLAHDEEADRRLRKDHTTLSGHLRVFATMDLRQTIVTRMVSRFLQNHPKVTAMLALTNRPLHMIQEGCDVGILPGKITDESVIARPVGMITLHLAASALIKSRPTVKELADLKSWPWIALAGFQFWSAKEITLFGRNGAEQAVGISSVLISEGVTSIREGWSGRRGASGLVDSGRLGFRTTRSPFAAVEGEGFADSRRLCRTTSLACSCESLRRLCGQVHDRRIQSAGKATISPERAGRFGVMRPDENEDGRSERPARALAKEGSFLRIRAAFHERERIYVGLTKDLRQRLKAHNGGMSGHTAASMGSHLVWRILQGGGGA